jgi:hypothetical protein
MVFFSGGKGGGEAVDYGYKGNRWKVERGISWLQRKYRRIVVRWERRMKYWEGFLSLGILLYWVRQLVICGFC